MDIKHHKFIQEAIKEARKSLDEGGIPIGAVLVEDGEIVGRGHNHLIQDGSSILHAEMDCLESAGKLKGTDYKKCTLIPPWCRVKCVLVLFCSIISQRLCLVKMRLSPGRRITSPSMMWNWLTWTSTSVKS